MDLELIKEILIENPDLGGNGFDKNYAPFSISDFKEERRTGQFNRAIAYIDNSSKIRWRTTINKEVTSYGLKHEAEKYYKLTNEDNYYISNGVFILAMLCSAYEYKKIKFSPNCFFNIKITYM